MLSEETVERLYGGLSPLEKVRRMVRDACDEQLIMDAVTDFGIARYTAGRAAGYRDCESRQGKRPGDGDMGG